MGSQLRPAPSRATATVYDFAAASDLPAAQDGDGEWLLSFADIITLLLTLFVLLLAISHFHPEAAATAPAPKARHVVKRAPAHPALPEPFPDPYLFSFNGTLPLPAAPAVPSAAAAVNKAPHAVPAEKPQPAAKAAPAPAHPPRPEPFPDPDLFSFSGTLPLPVAPAAPAAAGAAKTSPADTEPAAPVLSVPKDIRNQVEVARSAQAVNLIIKDDLLYPTGSAKLSAAGKRILERIADMLQQDDYPVSVEGYTDDTPIHTARFPSNWELSAARATNVTRYLIARGVAPGRLSAVGYGDTRPRADNATAAGRARNRRVSLVIHLPAAPAGKARPLPPPAASAH